MNRYHIKIGFKKEDIIKLVIFTNRLNSLNWQYSKHSIDNLNYRVCDVEGLLKFIKVLKLLPESIFEYYSAGSEIIKVCYRVNYGNADIILVLNEDKLIITIYLNSSNDNHDTLDKNIYSQVLDKGVNI